jgi:AraC-like DNA-binding protein
MDAFSEVLNAVKLKGALFFNGEFRAPWCFASPRSDLIAPDLMPGAEHLIIYHMLVEGSAWIHLEDGNEISLHAGDVVMFPHGDPHRMGSGVATEAIGHEAFRSFIRNSRMRLVQVDGAGEVARFVCGYMACDPQLCRPILSGLPRVLKVNVRTDASGQWLENSIRRMVEEVGAGTAGSQAMLAKLSEALFVDTLRRFVSALPQGQAGWLAGACDPIVGKSLAILHSRVDFPWTISLLAKEVGTSRSALAERFNRYLAESPMAYLTRWRLQLAARLLPTTSRSVAQIAGDVGYESEAAFNRAFKRAFGEPPARFRKSRREHVALGLRRSESAG